MKMRNRLADRLGLTVHCSPLGFKFKKLAEKNGIPPDSLDAWLVDLANHREAKVVVRQEPPEWPNLPVHELNNEELIVLICQPQRQDYPQMIRLAAQLISRNRGLDCVKLGRIAQRERTEGVLKALADQALRVDSTHPAWSYLASTFKNSPPLRDTILHWTRLAEPIPENGVCTGKAWKLVGALTNE